MSEKPILACKRCKVKKLRCDSDPKICAKCVKAGSVCVQTDSRSKRDYHRGYIEELLERIKYLKSVTQELDVASPAATGRLSASSFSPGTDPTYHQVGSVINMARLVEAAVIPTASTTAPLSMRLDQTVPTEDTGRPQAKPAVLPSKETAQQLFSSYLDGLHLLHPFLQRSTVLRELDETYTKPQSQTSPCLFRINMIFAIGAVALFRSGLHGVSPMDYYAAAMLHANKTFELAGVEQIQALLLVLIFSLQHDIGVGNKWDLARVAMRICIENNFHRTSRSLPQMDEQMRRRVFWACYISDRHSSSVLGRPLALQDEDIDVELPIDADDDLIESGHVEDQIIRGMSEVSAQLRQIRMRQITTQIGTRLYRESSHRPGVGLQAIANDIIADLDCWRTAFPIILEPRNAYETTQWRDLNYFRERLKCYRLLVLTSKEHETVNGSGEFATNLSHSIHAANQIATLYQALRTADKLILNWTCVHDMMSAGFSTLYCGIAQRQLVRDAEVPGTAILQLLPDITETITAVIDTLQYIAQKWPTVNRHFQAFRTLAERVSESIQPADHGQARGELRTPALLGSTSHGPTGGTVGWENSFAGNADMWDAAMAAFLDEPLDLGTIEWGAIDWDAMELLSHDPLAL